MLTRPRPVLRFAAVPLLLLTSLLVGPGRAAEAEAAKLARIEADLQAAVEAGEISGGVALVADRERVVHCVAVGLADIAAGRPMQKDTLFAIASMTKPIAAAAVMIVQDEGKLSVSDPVAKYLPEFAEVKFQDQPPARPITLADLMTHTSGVGGDQRNQGTLAETAAALARRPLLCQPGERWNYSPGLSVCGRVVEVVSGQPFEQFLNERIFKPLGMSDTTFFPDEAQQQRLARLYQPGEEKGSLQTATSWINDLSPDRTPNPSAGLFSTAGDLARFYQMILNEGEFQGRRVLSAEGVRQMTGLQTAEHVTGFTPGNGWGFGWCVIRQPQGVTGMLSPGSFGHGGAFGTQSWLDPHRGLALVLMIQRTGFGNSDASEIRGNFQRVAVEALGD